MRLASALPDVDASAGREGSDGWSSASVGGAHERHGPVRAATRLLALTAAVLYPAWGVVHAHLRPQLREPIAERFVVSLLLLVSVAASYTTRWRRHSGVLAVVAFFALSAHQATIAARNPSEPVYLNGAMLIIAILGFAMLTQRSRRAYVAFAVTVAVGLAVTSRVAVDRRLEFLLAIITVVCAHALGTRRRIAIEIAQRAELLTARRALEAKVEELERSQQRVRRLEGLLPICMHCRRIRRGDEEHGDWLNLEQFLSAHSGASFTHGICAECFAVHHPE